MNISDKWKERIDELCERFYRNAVEYRRQFHKYPELSFEEFETARFIARKLTEMGYQVRERVGGTGVIATLDTGREGPSIAFRADMDALPILEESGLDFASARAGIMHACGHDVHMAVNLAVAQIMIGLKDDLCGVIRFVFQPGEEANGGARCMIHDGALENPVVDKIFALHVIPELAAGQIAVKSGYMSATDDEFHIRVYGKSAHSSQPQTGVNAIVVASQIVNSLMSLLGLVIDPFDVATFSICKISGGEAVNVIPEYAELSGMIRCVEKRDKEILRRQIQRIAVNIAESMGAHAELEIIEGYPAVFNDPALTETVIEVASDALSSKEDIIILERPHLGSEDFAYFQEKIPGLIFMLGCRQDDRETGTLHSNHLNINEECIIHGMKMFVHIAIQYNLKEDGN